MNINNNNGKGQERVVSLRTLNEYCDWLNSSLGESFLRVTTGQTSYGRYTLKITSSLGVDASGNTYVVSEGETGVGVVYWDRTTNDTSTVSTSGNGSVTISAGTQMVSSGKYPKGKFHLEYNDGEHGLKKYLELNNTSSTDYTGYETMSVTGATDMRKCVTYHDITASTYVRYFNEQTMLDGLIITGYSVGDGKFQYDDNQLVVEKDVEFGKFQYQLEVDSITVEVDAMTDTPEYTKGVIPGSNNLAFASVYDVTNTTRTPFNDFVIGGLTDNETTSGKTYPSLKIEKYGSIATAPIKNGNYSIDVYYYDDSGYTLTSKTVTARTGTSVTSSITVSNHTFTGTSSSSSSSGTSRIVKVTISSNGEVTFDIKQRKEVYGYFPVDVYREGTSSYGIDEHGNVSLDKVGLFVKASTSTTVATQYSSTLKQITSGWADNAGDNFGEYALIDGKTSLIAGEKSTYDDVLTDQGISDLTICGKDVYNSNIIVYDRGREVGNYHVAYANDAYGSKTNRGGFKGTSHLFCSEGVMSFGTPQYSCTSSYFDYTFEPFVSEYEYFVSYKRDYYKDCHAYGITSILRRFRKIGDNWVDSAKSSYSANMLDRTTVKVPTNSTIQGNSFPKHIVGKSFHYYITTPWWQISSLASGDNDVSGWTTIYEASSTTEGQYDETYQTRRDIEYIYESSYAGRIRCEHNYDMETYYYNIYPFFYMVDAESCDGYSSGYTFKTPHTIIDYANGNYEGEEREYYLDCDHHFYSFGNNQMCKKDMVTYISLNSDGTPLYNSTRYGNTNIGGYVGTTCCPSAPKQRVYWVDSYGPSPSGGLIGNTPTDIAFVDDEGRYMGKGTTINTLLESFDAVPYLSAYDHFSYKVGINDINEFSGYTNFNGLYSFPGQNVYSASSVHSSHILRNSIAYMSGYTYDPDDDITQYLGYSIDSDNYNHSIPLRAVKEADYFVESAGTFVYTGASFVYFGRNGSTINYINNSPTQAKYKFLPVVCNNTTGYDNNKALRPCSGDVTIPYWYTDLTFGVRVMNQSPTGFNPWQYFSIKVYVDGHELVYNTAPTLTSASTNYYRVDRTTSIPFRVGSTDRPYRGVYCCFWDGTQLVMKDNMDSDAVEYYQELTIRFMFVDVYSNSFNIKVKCSAQDFTSQELSWQLNGEEDYMVGAETLVKLGRNDWGEYHGNKGAHPDDYSCIGDYNRNSTYNHTVQTSDTMASITTQPGGIPIGEDANNRTWY